MNVKVEGGRLVTFHNPKEFIFNRVTLTKEYLYLLSIAVSSGDKVALNSIECMLASVDFLLADIMNVLDGLEVAVVSE